MAIWPFGRRRKRPRKAADDETFSGHAADSRGFHQPNLKSPSHGSISGSGKATRRDSKRRKRNNILPTTNDIHENDTVRLTNLPPGSLSIASTRFHQQPVSVDTALSRNFATSHYHYVGTGSQTSLGHHPTLHGRRSSTEPGVFRRKSSRRRRNDYARELEIKNMSSHVTVLRRPSTVSPPSQWWESNNKRGTRNIKTAHAAVSSNVFLPADSGRSSPFDMEPCAYELSAFAALTPRPILRYAEPPRYGLESRDHSRASTNKERRQIIPAEELTRISRIHDLVDDMDAGALRELMERDRRRKEMKRIADQQKLQRKLQRRADLQREQERCNPPLPSQLATLGDGVDPLAGSVPGSAEKIAAIIPDRTSADTLEAVASSESWLRDPSKETLPDINSSSPKAQPLSRVNSGSAASRSPRGRSSNASHDISMSGMSGQRSADPIHGGRDTGSPSTSQVLATARGSTKDIPRNFELEKHHSDNAGKLSTSWTAFFRRGGSRFRRQNVERAKTPSEFSIPSRESFQRINQQQPAPAQPIPIPERSYTRPGILPRTQSKFKEHFTDSVNEFPRPPGRDFQSSKSPAVGSKGSTAAAFPSNEIYNASRGSAVVTPEQRDYSRSSGAGSPETNAESILLAHSLASIDSEGSWLSGRPSRHFYHPPKNSSSANSTKDRLDEYAEYQYRDDTDDHDHNNHSPQPHLPLEEDKDGGEKETFHASVGKRALLVRPDRRPFSNNANIIVDSDENDHHHRQHHLHHLRMETGGAGEGRTEADSPSPISPLEADSELRRATSVDLGKQHVRHISAGSARLLDISRRASDARRLSVDSAGSGALPKHA
ncbi:hypothetical protein AJ78_06204 [Emergomyces pasteurianus Ep9510]|uniref:Uncharacterized protein n=1 Tax=Emergomyces pasteurianus Ep9510 TaxID=1447872 RepID=A0A1J9PBK0_9EURO|nr:hypothetical protein AJ78_06204 [Emergomyces pasteurianus Ep9510]